MWVFALFVVVAALFMGFAWRLLASSPDDPPPPDD